MKNILTIIPAYNEEKNIESVLDELNRDFKEADILVINDASTDDTKGLVEKKKITCITLPYHMGYARAIQTGIRYALEYQYSYVVQFDADGQHIATEAKKLKEKMEKEGCDLVIGSRYMTKDYKKCNPFRRFGTNIFSWMIRLFCKKKITDPLSGFQCFNQKVIKRLAMLGKYPEYPDANLIMELIYDKFVICEVPVKMRMRKYGESMHSRNNETNQIYDTDVLFDFYYCDEKLIRKKGVRRMNLFFIIVAICLMGYILRMVIKGNFDMGESIFWICCSAIILVLAIFPKMLDRLSYQLGIYYSPSLLFLLFTIFLLIITFRNQEKIFKLKEKLDYIAQDLVILKEKEKKDHES